MIGSAATFAGELVPALLGVDRQAGVEPARDDRSGAQLDAELRGDGDPSLVVHRVPVLAGEHPYGVPWSLGWPVDVRGWWVLAARQSGARFPTSHHFGPLRCILPAESGRVNAEIAEFGGRVARHEVARWRTGTGARARRSPRGRLGTWWAASTGDARRGRPSRWHPVGPATDAARVRVSAASDLRRRSEPTSRPVGEPGARGDGLAGRWRQPELQAGADPAVLEPGVPGVDLGEESRRSSWRC